MMHRSFALACGTASATDKMQIFEAFRGGLAHLLQCQTDLFGATSSNGGRNEALDFGGLEAVLLPLLRHLAANHKLAHVLSAV
ncbi:40S ribosomal protein S6, putative, partial [Trypanosoma vivax Y486]